MDIRNKIFVITGAGNGMGREVTLNLLAGGASVAAVDLNEKALSETFNLAQKNSKNLSIHVLNITNLDEVQKLPEQIINIHGNIDALINNAGIIQPFVKINNLDFSDINRVMNVNFFGSLYMTKTFLPYLLKRPEAKIVNTSSMGGFLPVPGQSIYGASKAAVKLFTEGLRAELLNTNVKVSVVFPGAVGTNIASNSGIENTPKLSEVDVKNTKIKMTSVTKAAKIIVKGIEKNKTRIFIGNDSFFMDILYRINPVGAANLITKKMGSLLDN
jgi:short-subunit dehydrogenase